MAPNEGKPAEDADLEVKNDEQPAKDPATEQPAADAVESDEDLGTEGEDGLEVEDEDDEIEGSGDEEEETE